MLPLFAVIIRFGPVSASSDIELRDIELKEIISEVLMRMLDIEFFLLFISGRLLNLAWLSCLMPGSLNGVINGGGNAISRVRGSSNS